MPNPFEAAPQLVQPLLSGDRRALARLMTLVENDPAAAQPALRVLYPHTGRAHIVGVTGVPGTGKSTLVAALAREFRRRNRTVGIVAVDPTSPFTGGALLGDRVRMQDLAGDPGVFVRSMASRGTLGGLAEQTAQVVSLLDAFGMGTVFIETVGVGQDEVEVAREAQTVLVVGAPGLGDDVQALKSGLLETADIFVVNKSDREGADRLAAELSFARGQGSGVRGQGSGSFWHPPVLRTIATQGTGVPELMDALDAHRGYLVESRAEVPRLAATAALRVTRLAAGHLVARGLEALKATGEWDRLVEQVAARRTDPATAAERLVEAATTKGDNWSTGQSANQPMSQRTDEPTGRLTTPSVRGPAAGRSGRRGRR